MKNLLSRMIAAMFVTAISLSATAQSADTGAGGMESKPMESMAATAGESKAMGEHTMSGTITKINHKTGWLSLKTGLGTLELHYPPPAIKDLKKGEKISAHLGFSAP